MSKNFDFNKIFRNEWDQLGFYYELDEINCEWIIMGSKIDILKFCETLEQFSNKAKNKVFGDHEHYGPYSYLKYIYWSQPQIRQDGIYGNENDFKSLSQLIKVFLEGSDYSNDLIINREFTPVDSYSIRIKILHSVLLPSSLDKDIWDEN